MDRGSQGRLLAGRYRVLRRLGAGGMAVVVLAEDERLGREVAVKRLHAEGLDDAALRFEREAKVGASLNHPNIVAVYDTVPDEEGVLIVMEYVEGHTLRLEMDRGPLAPARVIEVLSGVAAALDHAHEHGVVHRDVKPANVLIADRSGAVKLADLGIATAAERTRITQSGLVLGTAAYMAPERLDGHAGGPPTDVYALAAVAFEALSGQKPVTGKNAMEVAYRVMNGPAPDLAAALPGAPPAAASALRRGLAKDAAERQASAGELVRDLAAAYAEAALAPEPTGPTRAIAPAAPAPTHTRSGRAGWIVPIALALVAAVILVVVLTSGGGGSTGGGKSTVAKSPATTKRQPATPSPPATTGDQQAPSAEPTSTVEDFYTRAASADFEGAWALGTDGLHSQFGSIDRFSRTFATLESISFDSLRTTSQTGEAATVAFSTVAKHTDRTEYCSGSADLVSAGASWHIDHIGDVQCKTQGAGSPPAPGPTPGKPSTRGPGKPDKKPKAKKEHRPKGKEKD
jgi:serine/threonine-protein kinase